MLKCRYKCLHSIIPLLSEITNFSMKYFVLSKFYTDDTTFCPLVWEIIHLLKLVDYLLVQADKLWYNCYVKLTNNKCIIYCCIKNLHFCYSLTVSFRARSPRIYMSWLGTQDRHQPFSPLIIRNGLLYL